MLYRVSRQYQRGGESQFAQFSDRKDAELFIATKQQEDLQLNVRVIYHLYQGAVMIDTYDVPGEAGDQTVSSGSASQAGASSTAAFKPTPFNMAPRPGGMPHNWLKEEDKKPDDSK